MEQTKILGGPRPAPFGMRRLYFRPEGDDAGASTGVAAMNAVGDAFPRLEPGGAGPPVTVTRSRASARWLASRTASAASRNTDDAGIARPSPRAEFASRS